MNYTADKPTETKAEDEMAASNTRASKKEVVLDVKDPAFSMVIMKQ